MEQLTEKQDRSQEKEYHKVVIIGAGMAGLGAARTLNELGCRDFVILEAQEKAGGRIDTIKWQEFVLELGAQFIHGEQNPLFELANEYGMLAEEKIEEGLGLYVRENGDIIDGFLVSIVEYQIGQILTDCENFVNSQEFPPSVGDYLELKFNEYLNNSQDPDDIKEVKRDLLDWHIRFQVIDNSCLDLHQLSAKYWGQYQCVDDEAHVNFKKGYSYDSLVQILVDNIPNSQLRLKTAVTDINYTTKPNDPIQLTCENGSVILCDHVIITPSLGVLKDHLKITPPLPDIISNSIENMGFYGIGKIFLIFDYNWWKAEGFQFIWNANTVLEGEDKWIRYIQGFDAVANVPNVLLGWVGGHGVQEMEDLSDEQIGTHCMQLLRKFLKYHYRDIPEPIKVFRSKWMSNPYVRGAYCHITPKCDHSSSGIEQLSTPVFAEGKLKILLAGEAIHSTHYSTTHGAYESGIQQARVLYESLES